FADTGVRSTLVLGFTAVGSTWAWATSGVCSVVDTCERIQRMETAATPATAATLATGCHQPRFSQRFFGCGAGSAASAGSDEMAALTRLARAAFSRTPRSARMVAPITA